MENGSVISTEQYMYTVFRASRDTAYPGHRVFGKQAKKKTTQLFLVEWVKNSRVTKQGVLSDQFCEISFKKKCRPNYKTTNALNMKESLTCLGPKA